MLKINILSASHYEPFKAQWNKSMFPENEYYIRENSLEDIDWDIVVVYENIKNTLSIKCRKGHLIYFAGEPPMMRPLPNRFIAQFDEIFVPNIKSKHERKHLSHGFLNWSLGVNFRTKEHKYTYEDIKNWKPQKNKIISIVTSNKKMMPGHNKRMLFIKKLMSDFPGQIDFYGAGHNQVDFKADALLPYKFHICLENSDIPYYWTEKFSDPLLAKCVPIYCGCTNLSEYFDENGYISFSYDDYDSLRARLIKIFADPESEYESFRPYMEANRLKLMEELNLIPFVIKEFGTNESDIIQQYTVSPLQCYREYWNMFKIIRAKRFLYRVYSHLFE